MTGARGRVLAIDLGSVRIGLALSDPLGITAQPAGFVPRARGLGDDLSVIRDLVRAHEATRVVVGLPLLLSGEAGERARDATRFAEELRAGLPAVTVDLWDERFTTKEASRVLIAGNVRRRKRKEVVDSLAAVLILQSYLESRRGIDEAP